GKGCDGEETLLTKKNYFLGFETGFVAGFAAGFAATTFLDSAFFGSIFFGSAFLGAAFLVSGVFFVTTIRCSTPILEKSLRFSPGMIILVYAITHFGKVPECTGG
ncbi:MAG: hypothetical protein Q7V05_05550, partial [Methanoregula sp.]|nr:hypothetical protein [Methanoregula sp.]